MTSKWYLLTLPAKQYVYAPSALPDRVDYIKGQLELSESGLLHWQFVLHCTHSLRSRAIRSMYPSAHVEATRSSAATAYVWKEETSVSETRFEIGTLPMQRSSKKNWEDIWNAAKVGELDAIPPDVRIRSYTTIRRISKDYMVPTAVEREIYVFFGTTGTGKSRRAWHEAGFGAYPKDPNTKFWDGYDQHEHVVIDEFRGAISISHILRWLDRYPVIVENKGGAICFTARKIWITSNLHPDAWYPDLDEETRAALRRRFTIIQEFSDASGFIPPSIEELSEENVEGDGRLPAI